MDNILSSQFVNWTFNELTISQKREEVFRSAVRKSIVLKDDYESCDMFSNGSSNHEDVARNLSDSDANNSFISETIPDDDNFANNDTSNHQMMTPFSETSRCMNLLNINTPENQKTRAIHYNMCFSSPLRKTNFNYFDNSNSEVLLEHRIDQRIQNDYITIEEQQYLIYHYSLKIINICMKCVKYFVQQSSDFDQSINENIDPNVLKELSGYEALKNNLKDNELLIRYHYFISKSIIYFRRFYLEKNITEFDITYAIYGSILIASKIENLPLPIIILKRYIEEEISFCLSNLTRLSDLSDQTLASIEIKISETIHYNFFLHLPFDSIINFLSKIDTPETNKAILKLHTIELCQKIALTDYIFLYTPNDIALCILNKVLNCDNFNFLQISDIVKHINASNMNVIHYPEYPLPNDQLLADIHLKYMKSLSIILDPNYINYKRKQKLCEREANKSSGKKKYKIRSEMFGISSNFETNGGFHLEKTNLFPDSDNEEFRGYQMNENYEF